VRNLLTRRQDSERAGDDLANERVPDRRAGDRRTGDDPVVARQPATHRTAVQDRAGAQRPATGEPDTLVERPPWAHVSALATVSMIIGVLAIAATLTGLLAVEGVALGVVGGAVAAGGLVGASRRGVTGHSLAILGLVASLAAILLGVLAIAGQLSWLDSRTDEVARAHDWLVAQLPWIKRW
jgi:hypothetical protein